MEHSNSGDFPDIQSLLPHRPPLLFIERILSLDESEARCEIVAGNGCFASIKEEEICASVGLEYMAQTAAVLGGSLAAKRGSIPQSGMIASVRNMQFHCPHFVRGARLEAQAKLLESEGGTAIFETKLFDGSSMQLLQSARIVVVTS